MNKDHEHNHDDHHNHEHGDYKFKCTNCGCEYSGAHDKEKCPECGTMNDKTK